MSHARTVKCAGCGDEIRAWRACPDKKCPTSIGYCQSCGGDDRAVPEMTTHIATHVDARVRAGATPENPS